MDELNGTGVYRWVNKVNEKCYVGGAYNSLRRRRNNHLRELRRGTHFNKHLQHAWNKDGENNFVWEVLEHCVKEEVEGWETIWIGFYQAADPKLGYNVMPVAGGFGPLPYLLS